jgi:hypothetical protein
LRSCPKHDRSRQRPREVLPSDNELRVRAGRLPSPSPAQVALVAAKSWAERRVGAYWSPAELRAMLDAAGYALVSLAEAPSILAVAERPR